MGNYVRIFDTTLRDGEQSPGATMTSSEKLEIAKALSRLGVDVIEAGFPAASPDDLAAVRAIAEHVGREPIEGRPSSEPPTIVGLARATKGDIDAAWEGIRPAKHPCLHTFLSTSDLHMKHKLRMSREQVLARIAEMVAYAKTLCPAIEFSPEDAGRSEPEFLYQVLDTAIRAGATTLNIPDTVGYTTPDEFGSLIAGIFANVPGIDDVIVSVHCHNDLGLATANTLAGIRAGARQAEVTINGIGERAGNTSLEEVVMALHTRAPKFGLTTGIDTTQLARVSRMVSTATGIVVQPNKAVVGANAFAHESGIHQDGMLKHEATYEIMRPETVGVTQTNLVLGKHSGRAALSARLVSMGYSFDGPALDRVFARFKALADRRKQVHDADLEALVHDEAAPDVEAFTLEGLLVGCGTMGMPTATVRLRCPDGKVRVHAAVGTGPVDAAYKAVDAIVQTRATLLEFTVRSVTEGIDALGEVAVRIRELHGHEGVRAQHDGPQARVFHGNGADTDIIVASVKAYLRAQNRLMAATGGVWDAPVSRRDGVVPMEVIDLQLVNGAEPSRAS
ncbi:2-isopropylmalate synthase [Pendulispora albinea]|uniref:2-isopropylmalate synthase n=1 Tax=Pendulispora albinea TaxID=2741071 RepID=A0ABZ2M8I4_9BACT